MPQLIKHERLRQEVKQIIEELGLQYGWRKHFARAIACHPSTINNAVNGHRIGPRENIVLVRLHKYLIGLNRYYQKRAYVNTKTH